MTDFLEDWANESKANKKICAREDLVIDITEDLLIAMEDKGITKSDLAKRLSKSKSFVTQTLNGARNMTLHTLADICFALEIKPKITLNDSNSKVCINGEHRTFNWETEFINIPNSAKIIPIRKNRLIFKNITSDVKYA